MNKTDSNTEKPVVTQYVGNIKFSIAFYGFIFIMYSLVYTTKNCFGAAMASIVDENVLTKSQTGTIMAAFYLAYGIFQFPGGYAADRFKSETLMAIGLIGGGIANIIIFFNQNYYVMLAAWIFNAVTQFGMWPSVFKTASSKIHPAYRKKGVFFLVFASLTGLTLSYLIGGFIGKWQYNFAFSAVVLFALIIPLHIMCKKSEKYLVDAPIEEKASTHKDSISNEKISSVKLFFISGLLFMFPTAFVYSFSNNALRTFSPTILMESYGNINPSLANLLNVIIILSGVVGVLTVRFVIYPRCIKNEALCAFLIMLVSVPFLAALSFIGKMSVPAAIVSMCGSVAMLTSVFVLDMNCNMYFSKYGKDGMAAGINNAVQSIGIMCEAFIVPRIAESSGWQTTMKLYVILSVTACVFASISIPMWKKFTSK